MKGWTGNVSRKKQIVKKYAHRQTHEEGDRVPNDRDFKSRFVGFHGAEM